MRHAGRRQAPGNVPGQTAPPMKSPVERLMRSVQLFFLQGLVINRFAGIDYPLWAPRRGQPPEDGVRDGISAQPQ
jgi:hypothetical protein